MNAKPDPVTLIPVVLLSAFAILWASVLFVVGLDLIVLSVMVVLILSAGLTAGYLWKQRLVEDLGVLVIGDFLIFVTIPFLVAGGAVFAIASTVNLFGVLLASAGVGVAVRRRIHTT